MVGIDELNALNDDDPEFDEVFGPKHEDHSRSSKESKKT